jgi:hypothetical protein
VRIPVAGPTFTCDVSPRGSSSGPSRGSKITRRGPFLAIPLCSNALSSSAGSSRHRPFSTSRPHISGNQLRGDGHHQPSAVPSLARRGAPPRRPSRRRREGCASSARFARAGRRCGPGVRRSALPPGTRPGRRTRHALAPRPLSPRPREALSPDGRPGKGGRALDHHRVGVGDPVVATAERSRPARSSGNGVEQHQGFPRTTTGSVSVLGEPGGPGSSPWSRSTGTVASWTRRHGRRHETRSRDGQAGAAPTASRARRCALAPSGSAGRDRPAPPGRACRPRAHADRR